MKLSTKCLKVLLLIILFSACGERSLLKRYGEKPASIEVIADKAFVKGTLGKLFYSKFVKTLEKHPEIKTIVLVDIPGSVNDEWNLKSCLLLYEKGLNTELLSNSIVESGGADLFVSGKELIIADGAKIGVHSWAGGDKPATAYPKDHPEHKMFLDLYSKVGIDPSFYWYTLNAAPADSIHYMTKNEIETYLGNKLKQ